MMPVGTEHSSGRAWWEGMGAGSGAGIKKPLLKQGLPLNSSSENITAALNSRP
jgi:hypothetical protein